MESLAEFPFISIIVPIYNSAKWLRRCIDSIVNQTYRNLQIILVNDGSTDGSEEICNTYLDPRIQYISIPHQGVSAARNEGLSRMRGEYLAFVDSDDFLSPQYIESLYEAIMKCSAQVAMCKYDSTDEESCMNVPMENFFSGHLECAGDMQVITGREAIRICRTEGTAKGSYGKSIWNKLYSIAYLKLDQFDTELIFGEDTKWLWSTLLQCEKVALSSQTLYTHVSSTTKKAYMAYEPYLKFYQWERHFFIANHFSEELINVDQIKINRIEAKNVSSLLETYITDKGNNRYGIPKQLAQNWSIYEKNIIKNIDAPLLWRIKMTLCLYGTRFALPGCVVGFLFRMHN